MEWNRYFIADFDAGTLTWRRRSLDGFPTKRAGKMWNTRFAGTIAGSANRKGYHEVGINPKSYYVHRVIWQMAHGPIPEGMEIDHVDRNKANNAISNLRLATRSENNRNVGVGLKNKSGHVGVNWDKRAGKWVAKIMRHGRRIILGYFDDINDAVSARAAGVVLYHGSFAPSHKVQDPEHGSV